MAWETVIAPAPMAMTVSAAANGEVSPSALIREPSAEYRPRMPAVVVMATVDEPCAVLRMAAMMNGKKMPTLDRKDACSVM